MKVFSDSSEAASVLQEITDILRDNDAIIPDTLTAHIENGSMWLSLTEDVDIVDPPVLKVPERLFVCVDRLDELLYLDDARFIRVQSRAGFLPAINKTLLELMVSLYNLTNKVATYEKSSSLWFDRVAYSAPMCDVAELRAQSGEIALGKHHANCGDGGERDRLLLHGFISTRTINWQMTGELKARTCLMPLVDMANHHKQGASFEKSEETDLSPSSLSLQLLPLDSTRQVYASYGVKDALDLWIHYGYADLSTTYFRSAPCQLSLGNNSILLSVGSTSNNRRYPSIECFSPGFLRVDSLVWDVDNLPGSLLFALTRIFAGVPKHLLGYRLVRDYVKEAADKLLDINHSLHDRALESFRASKLTEEPVQSLLSDYTEYTAQAEDVLAHQLDLIARTRTSIIDS